MVPWTFASGLAHGDITEVYSMTDAKNVTERESHIIAQALYEFIRLEQSKPRDVRRLSDEHDAKAVLHARFDKELAMLVQSDEAAGRQPPDCGRKVSIGGSLGCHQSVKIRSKSGSGPPRAAFMSKASVPGASLLASHAKVSDFHEFVAKGLLQAIAETG